MELRHVRSFIAVAEELNFGRAARRLGLSQPPLSKQIQALEASLGVVLFDRTSTGVRLTKGGEAALREAYLLVERSEHLRQAARRADSGIGGSLVVAFQPSALYEVLLRVMQIFRGRCAEAEILMMEFETAEAIQELRSGRADVAVIRTTQVFDPLRSFLVSEDQYVVALPKGHRLSGVPLLHLKDIEGEPLVVLARRSQPRSFNAILEAFERAGIRPNLKHEALSFASITTLVASGEALGFVPSSLPNPLAQGIVLVPVAEDISFVGLSLVWNADVPSRLVDHFVASASSFASAR